MAETSNVSLQSTLQSFFHTPILAQRNSHSNYRPMERGPRYEAYDQLRESKLRLKFITQQHPQRELDCPEPDTKVVTQRPTKLVRFQSSSERERNSVSRSNGGRRGYSVLAQSVPDFSAEVLRKENRKPVSTTPPAVKSFLRASGLKGSKSASNAREKRGGGVQMVRKSYATVDELRNFSLAVGNAITGESGGGGRKTVLGCRKF